MDSYKDDIRFRYKCDKCGERIGDQVHIYCMAHGMPDLCFAHQPRTINKEIKQYQRKGVKYEKTNNADSR
jgi:hypothetical protein